MVERLRSQPPRKRSGSLHPPPNAFFGRARELRELYELFAGGERLVTLLGPAGTGKTRLSLRFAELHGQELHPRGTWFCDLTEARDPDAVCVRVASTLGLSLASAKSAEEVERIIARGLSHRGPVLLVLDNCEQAIDAVAQLVSQLLHEAADLRIMATSRERLRLPAERCLDLPPLSLPRRGDDPARSEAVQLFVDRARHVRPDFALAPDDVEAVSEILRRLDGLPLAIELAAARMRVLSPSMLLQRLTARFELLTEGARDATARQRTLRGAIDWSWELLEPWEKSALAQCSVFRGGFTLASAEAVLDLGSHATHPSVLDAVQSLCDKSLVVSTGGVRYALYESVREYAAQKLIELGAQDETRARHRDHFLHVGSAWAETANDRGGADDLRRLVAEHENLRQMQAQAMAGSTKEALRAMLVVDAALSGRGSLLVHLSLFDATLGKPEQSSDAEEQRLRGTVVLQRALVHLRSGQWAEAEADIALARNIASTHRDPLLEARALLRHSTWCMVRGRLDDARMALETALPSFCSPQHRRMFGGIHRSLGQVHHRAGRLLAARPHYLEALAVMRELRDEIGEASVLGDLAVMSHELGQLDEARAQFEQAIAIDRAVGDTRHHGVDLVFFGCLEHEHGELERAVQLYREAAVALEQTGDRPFRAYTKALLGVIAATRDDRVAARRAIEESEAELEALGARPRLLAVQVHRGHLDLALSRECAARGDHDGRARHRAAAERRARDALASSSLTDEVRFARRLLDRALLAGSEGAPAAALVVGEGCPWFELSGHARVDLRRRRMLQSFLQALVSARLESPGRPLSSRALVEAIWPGERMFEKSGQNRLYVALSRLRELGLRDAVRTEGDGYFLDPGLPLVVHAG